MENLEQPKWYVVHTYSGYENSVETDLRNMIENNNLQDYIFDIKIPVEDDVVERNGKKKSFNAKIPELRFHQNDLHQPYLVYGDKSTRGYEFCWLGRSSYCAYR